MERKITRKIRVGKLFIGGNAPISVQSMTNVSSSDADALIRQIGELTMSGCDIVRMTVPDDEAVKSIYRVKEAFPLIPLVADIHFSSRLAVESVYAGCDKVRINPGNIGTREKVRDVIRACREKSVPIRIGINGGSLENDILAKYGSPTAEAVAESASKNVRLLENEDFVDIIISVKCSDVNTMVNANRIISERFDYPLHLGVTEAGGERFGLVKSFVGIGSLLCDGIGNTIRISLTGDPVHEAEEGVRLLTSLGLYEKNRVNIVSCPTCGRTKYNMLPLVSELESRYSEMKPSRRVTVAVMGCVVNGPGEAKGADICIVGGDHEGLLFLNGQPCRKIPENQIVPTLIDEVNRI